MHTLMCFSWLSCMPCYWQCVVATGSEDVSCWPLCVHCRLNVVCVSSTVASLPISSKYWLINWLKILCRGMCVSIYHHRHIQSHRLVYPYSVHCIKLVSIHACTYVRMYTHFLWDTSFIRAKFTVQFFIGCTYGYGYKTSKPISHN